MSPSEASFWSRVAALLREWLSAHSADMLEAALELAAMESPSSDTAALARMARALADRFARDGAEIELLPTGDGRSNVWVRSGMNGVPRPPVLVLGHFDTVWPVGTRASMPIRT